MKNYSYISLLRILLCLLGMVANPVYSQKEKETNEPWNNKKLNDSARFVLLDNFIWDNYIFTDPDSSLIFADKLYALAKESKEIKLIALALNTKGSCYYMGEDFANAIKFYNKSLKTYQSINDLRGCGTIYNNLGNIYKETGDHVKAINYYIKSLRIDEKLNNKKGMSTALNNIGILYADQNNFEKAKHYYYQSIRIRKEINDTLGIGDPLNNIGNVFESQKKYKDAIYYYTLSLRLDLKTNNTIDAATSYNNIAGAYKMLGDEQKDKNTAKKYYQKALDLSQKAYKMLYQLGEHSGIATAMLIQASVKEREKKYKEAVELGEKALNIAQKIGAVEYIQDISNLLYETYKKLNLTDKSLKMYELSIQMKDSLLSLENRDEIIHQEYKYAYEKQAEADSILQAKEKEITNAQLKQERTQRFSLYGGLAFLLIFALIMYNRYKVTRSQKEIISLKEQETARQKNLLEVKNKEITDSINYAKRIQAAILPPAKIVKEYLKDSFILYIPRDIVAGDFYWMEQIPSGLIFAAADCTGHGVPGALISVVCNNALNRSVREYKLIEPGQILDKTREIILSEFEKSENEVNDGMDVSLCAIHYPTIENPKTVLQWAGANSPLWIIRNKELIEYKPDKQPIGKYYENQPFHTHTLELQKGDCIYVFTDGFKDQFGSEFRYDRGNGKKMKIRRMKELLLSISHEDMEIQKQKIEQYFHFWKGNLEQVDDVCIIGVRIV